MELITNTFVQIAPDSSVGEGTIPKMKGDKRTVAGWQYELLKNAPYTLTLEDLMFQVYISREGLTPSEVDAQEGAIREKLFGKPYPCMRASPLPKTHGWGVHHDDHGRIALFGVESKEYQRFVKGPKGLTVVTAMRSKRA